MNTSKNYWIGIDWANNLNYAVDELNEQIKGFLASKDISMKEFEEYQNAYRIANKLAEK